MSTLYFKIFPLDPLFVPDSEQIAIAIAEYKLFDEFSAPEVSVFPNTSFIDQGEYYDAAICPVCSARNVLAFNEEGLDEWLCSLEKLLQSSTFESIKTTIPTCGHLVDLSLLRFDPPAGFAKFQLCIRYPELNGEVPVLLNKLTKIFGTPVTGIWARY